MGTTIASGPAEGSGEVSVVPLGADPLTRIVSSRRPYSPDALRHRPSREPVLGIRGDGVLEVEDQASTGRVFAFSSARSLEAGM